MAKAKKRKKRSSTLNTRIKTMATKRRKKRSPVRSLATRTRTKRRTKKRTRSLSSGGGNQKVTMMKAGAMTLKGATGGALYALPQFVLKMPWWGKAIVGLGGSFGLHMMKHPNLASGIGGAFAYDMLRMNFALNDDLQDTNFVDQDTLSDSGQYDNQGRPILIADNGQAYALNDDEELEEMGDVDSLNDNGFNLQSVSSVPLQDANMQLADLY